MPKRPREDSASGSTSEQQQQQATAATAASPPKKVSAASAGSPPRTSAGSVDRRPLDQKIKDVEISLDRLQCGTYENEIEYLQKVLELKQKQKDMLEQIVAEKRKQDHTKIDAELDELIVKWRTAAQESLHALFSEAKDTPGMAESMMRSNRKGAFFDEEHDGSSGKRRRTSDSDDEAEEEPEEEDQEFTLGKMLEALGVNRKLVRYDEDEDDFES